MTVILLTLNKPPRYWQEHYKRVLLHAIGDMPLVIISKEPMDWERPNTIYGRQDEVIDGLYPDRVNNIFAQLLKATKISDTPYIALVDDDTMYHTDHFTSFRPPLNKMGFNYNRWAINEWERDRAVYYYCPVPDNPVMIAPRQKLIDGLDGISNFNQRATHFMRECVIFYSFTPVVCFHHTRGLAFEAAKKYKKPWPVQALSLPWWGDASNLIREWREDE
uniref:Glycosyltransferase n=1 Tax=viral metagenome TaxID=1070528 RepID=A0A6H1ZR65_9ZZZZ